MRHRMFCPSRTLIRDNLLVESSCLEPHQISSPVGWHGKSQSKKGTTVSRQADLCSDPITKACRGLELEPQHRRKEEEEAGEGGCLSWAKECAQLNPSIAD